MNVPITKGGALTEPVLIPQTRCPRCQAKLGGVASLERESGPAPGDRMLCVTCGLLLFFLEGGYLRRAVEAEYTNFKQTDRNGWALSKALGARYN